MAGIAAAFVYQLTLARDLDAFIARFGFVPSSLYAVLEADAPIAPVAIAALASMFLHGGWLHVIGNLLYLRVFGDNVEDRFGHVLFVFFYLASGFVGAGAQYAFDPQAEVPMIGASGAIAGVLGAYIVLFPRAKVVTLFPVFIFLTFIEVPAAVFLFIWGAQQLLNGYFALTEVTEGSVAWFAHLGGFGFGVVMGALARILKRRKKRRSASQK